MEIASTLEQGCATIRLRGRFDFAAHREFRAAIEKLLLDSTVRRVRVDLAGVDYLDSSALGMLLILRDKAQVTKRAVELAGARGSVAQVLEIANFKSLFTLI